MGDSIQAVTGIATALIAVATLVIALRQTQIASEQRRLGERQTVASENQAEWSQQQHALEQRLAQFELDRNTPVLVPNHFAEIPESGKESRYSFFVENVGGGVATDVWIESVLILIHDPNPEMASIVVRQRIQVVRDREMVTLEGVGYLPSPEIVLAMSGKYAVAGTTDAYVPLRYEVVPGFASRLDALGETT